LALALRTQLNPQNPNKMKVTLYRPNVQRALGFPSFETFEVTRRQLRVWNARHYKFGGISYNENWNEAQGLPSLAACAWLKSVHASRFGLERPDAQLAWKDLENALG
jgi:hypothetical protein